MGDDIGIHNGYYLDFIFPSAFLLSFIFISLERLPQEFGIVDGRHGRDEPETLTRIFKTASDNYSVTVILCGWPSCL